MSAEGITVPPLNDQQCVAILEEAGRRGMAEGGVPADPDQRLKFAGQLVANAKQAFDIGNHDDDVMSILFIAEVEMNPQVPVPPMVSAPVPPPGMPTQAPPMAPPPAAPPVAAPPAAAPASSSFDLTTMSNETIANMIGALENPQYANQPNVLQELEVLRGEQTRRAGGQPSAPPPQSIPPAAQAQTPAQAPAPPVAPAAPPAPPAAPVGAVPPGLPVPPAAGGDGAPGIQQPPADAQPPAVAEAPQPTVQGDLSATPQPADQEAAERAALEQQLTLAALRAWGVEEAAVPTLSMETLRGIVSNPEGPVATDTTATAPEQPAAVTDQREALIAQITGPILKAYGQGRKEIAGIGENELTLMVSYPEANITQEQLMAARQADGSQSTQLPPTLRQQAPAPPQPAAPPPGTPGAPVPAAPPAPVVAPPPPAAMPPAPPSAFAPPAPEQQQMAPAPVAPPQPPPAAPPMPPAPAPVQQAPVQPVMAPPAGTPSVPIGDGNERAMQIIQAENMPIPPEIDGDPPRLPNDLSKVGDAELQSFHARFHACEVRANWVIAQFDDEIGDVKKLLRNRRREVWLTIGTVDENNKKLTKDAKDSLIEADEYVQQYLTQLEEIDKTVGKLKVLRDGYHQDVSTCSRQWSMRSGEAEKQPSPR